MHQHNDPCNTKTSFFSSLNEEKKDVLIHTCYIAPIGYYAAMFKAATVYMEVCENYTKQSYRNRCTIAGANQTMHLTIPIEKPSTPKCLTKDIRIADHGNWRHLHWNAIISAYNSSPFFDYYRDDFEPLYQTQYTFLFDFNETLRQLIFRLLQIETPVQLTTEFADPASESFSTASVLDMREAFHPKKTSICTTPSYYQVFAHRRGFEPNLSIIDLLFNMGNEARLVLARVGECVE